MWPFTLSVRLPPFGLVGRYPANYLLGRRPLSQRIAALTLIIPDRGLQRHWHLYPDLHPRLEADYLQVTLPSATKITTEQNAHGS